MKKGHTLLIVFHDMRLGGIQKKIIDIIKYHQKYLPQTKIILCLREQQGIFLKNVPKNIEIISPNFYTRRFNMTWFTIWLIKKIATIKPTQILSFMDLGSIPTLIVLNLLPWIKPSLTIGEDILTSKYIFTESFPSLRKLLIRWLYPQANTILVQTPIQKKDLEQMIYKGEPKKNILASPNWLPLDYPPLKLTPQNKRKIDVLFVGRLNAQKNLPLFLKIIKLVTKNMPKLKVKIIGDGDDRKKIIDIIKKLSLQKNVKIIKPTLNTSKYYSNSKIFLLSSDYEGFPLTLMEAISSGCIPVLRNIPEISQFFTKDKGKIIYDTEIKAAKLIIKHLTIPNTTFLQTYFNLILKDQKKHIKNYIKYFYRPINGQ